MPPASPVTCPTPHRASSIEIPPEQGSPTPAAWQTTHRRRSRRRRCCGRGNRNGGLARGNLQRNSQRQPHTPGS